MILLKTVSIALLIIACVCLGNIGFADAPKNTLTGTMRTEHFIVRFDPSSRYLAKIVAESAEDELRRISKEFDYDIKNPVAFPLNVYSTHLSFIDAGGLEKSKYTVGTSRSDDQSISVDASGAFVSTKEVLAHEITHSVIFRVLGPTSGMLPLWVNEGLAKYESDDFNDNDNMLVANAAAEGGLIPLSDLTVGFPKNKIDLAYAESASAIRFMVRKFGKSSPRLLINNLAKTGSFESAMKSVTKYTPEEFEDAWIHSIAKRYQALRFVGIIGSIGGALMAILVIIAFLVRRKQKIEAAKRWEWEEFDESMRRQLGNDWWR